MSGKGLGEKRVAQFLVQMSELELLRLREVPEDMAEDFAPLFMLFAENLLTKGRQTQAHQLAVLGVMLASDPLHIHETVDERGGGRRRDVERFCDFLHGKAFLFADQKQGMDVQQVGPATHLHLPDHLLAHDAPKVVGALNEAVDGIVLLAHGTRVK